MALEDAAKVQFCTEQTVLISSAAVGLQRLSSRLVCLYVFSICLISTQVRRLTAEETGEMFLPEYQHWPGHAAAEKKNISGHRNVFTTLPERHQLFDAELVRNAGGAEEIL